MFFWWAEQGSNLWPQPCKGCALPAELSARLQPTWKAVISIIHAKMSRKNTKKNRRQLPVSSNRPFVLLLNRIPRASTGGGALFYYLLDRFLYSGLNIRELDPVLKLLWRSLRLKEPDDLTISAHVCSIRKKEREKDPGISFQRLP
jgi:hypothetical protein